MTVKDIISNYNTTVNDSYMSAVEKIAQTTTEGEYIPLWSENENGKSYASAYFFGYLHGYFAYDTLNCVSSDLLSAWQDGDSDGYFDKMMGYHNKYAENNTFNDEYDSTVLRLEMLNELEYNAYISQF